MNDYLTVVEVLAMHGGQIDRYGGSHRARNPGLLEAAIFRPQTGYYADLIEEAAARWESMSQNHPFIDGNKRTAFAAAYTFLAINGRTRYGERSGDAGFHVDALRAKRVHV